MAGTAEDGDRWPFDWGRLDLLFSLEVDFCVVDFLLAAVFGLRLRARARASKEESESSGSLSSDIVAGDFVWPFAVEDRVIGAK